MASVGRRHDPLVMRLVKVLVDEWVVQIAMNPVDAEVGEDEEDGELGEVVPKSRAFIGRIVELAVSADFEAHQRGCAERHERHGLVGLNDLEPDLVLDELGVVQGTLVEDEDVRERSKEEVDEESENPDNEVQCNELTENIVARPCAHVGRLRWLNIDELARRFVCPGGEGLARVGGDALGEVIGSRECWVCPGIDIVGDEGIGELEYDIHLEWVDRERRLRDRTGLELLCSEKYGLWEYGGRYLKICFREKRKKKGRGAGIAVLELIKGSWVIQSFRDIASISQQRQSTQAFSAFQQIAPEESPLRKLDDDLTVATNGVFFMEVEKKQEFTGAE